jgi:hypothetical protein
MFFIVQFKVRGKIAISFFVLALSFISTFLSGQILNDSASINLIKESVDYIYDGRFDKAEEQYSRFIKLYPGNPVPFLLKGMIIYWQNYPLLPSSVERTSYENHMRRCIDLAEKQKDTVNKAEFLLADLSARGMLLLFYADNGLSSEVIPLSASTYQYIRRAFDYSSSFHDFLFFTGLYNYYREAYPEAHPVYKAFAFIFPKGDRKKGLNEIENASRNALLLKTQSSSFLAGICLTYENNFKMATQYSKSLYEKYPSNAQFLAEYIKSLLLEKKYDEAERLLINSGSKNSNSFFLAQTDIFNGIIQEKKYVNLEQAEHFYKSGIRALKPYEVFGKEFTGYGYFGLSRISQIKMELTSQKDYRKKATDLSTFKNLNFDD